MSKSPLSGAFSGSSEPAKKKNGAILLIAGIALTSSIGGVFASTAITLNDGTLEFGQGVAATVVCDSEIDTALEQEFVTGTTFRVTNVALSSIDDTECAGEAIKVALVDENSATITSTVFRSPGATEDWDVSGENVTSTSVRNVVITTEN